MAIYIKYDGINGDVTTTGYEKWIEASSFQFGIGRGIASPTGSSADREASTPSVSEVTFTKEYDVSSGDLIKEAYSSEGSKTVKIDFVRTDKGGGTTYLEFTLSDVMISGFSVSSGGDRPNESISLNFVKIETKFTGMTVEGKAGSPSSVTYDLGKQALS